MGNVKLFFEVISRLSEALVCFRASRDNVLRSITRAMLNKNDEKRKKLFFDVSLRLSEILVCFRASRDNFVRSTTKAIVNKCWNHFGIILGLFWDHVGIILE